MKITNWARHRYLYNNFGQHTNDWSTDAYLNDKSSCIDFPTTTNSKLLCDVEVEQTIYKKYHHNIIYGSLNLDISLPPPYYREVWDYKNTDPVCIECAISLVNWNDVFSNKTADEKVKSLNNILLNIFRNFIPNKVVKGDYKYPKWMNPKIISSMRIRSKLAKRYTLIQLKRIKTFSPLNQTSVQTWSLRPKKGTQH